MSIFLRRALCFALTLFVLSACTVDQVPTAYSPLAVNNTLLLKRLDEQVDIHLNTGYSRTLKIGSIWSRVGSLVEGEVYKPYRDVFTVEGSHVHEAYLVVSNNMLQGFYLPVEHTFSPLNQKIPLTFNNQE